MFSSSKQYDTVPVIDMEAEMPEILTRKRAEDEEAVVTSMVGIPSKMDEATQLLESLTLKQKIRMVSGKDLWHLKAIPQFNLPSIVLTDGPHGVRKQEGTDQTDLLKGRIPATCFPTASCAACSWNPTLLERVGEALGIESRNEDVTVLLGPGLNILRHPCGGRNFEYFSEDPLLSGKLAAAMTRGIQSQHVGACIKHFAVNNQETWRFVVDAIVDERTLREIYYRGFEIAVKESHPWTVMCCYNRVNGLHGSENHIFFEDLLRKEWGFDGLVMTDWGASNNRSLGISAGVDLEMPGSHGAFDKILENAIKKGELSEYDLDQSAKRVLSLIMLGADVKAKSKPVLDMEAHHKLAYEVALESVVLLKNNNNLLPMALNTSIAVIGAFAKSPRFQGMGSSQVLAFRTDTAYDRMAQNTKNLTYSQGYIEDSDHLAPLLIDEAVVAASNADICVIFAGLPQSYETEAIDRTHTDLPESHDNLITAVAGVKSRIIVVLTNGSPVRMPWVDQVDVVLEGWLHGQAGGAAVADLLFGLTSPSGKLAQTFPIQHEDCPSDNWFPGDFHQVQYREGLNVGYRFFETAKVPVLFPFGHGLSYTSFEYSQMKVKKVIDTDLEILVEVEVKIRNTGDITASEVVQLYVNDCEASVYRPEHELKGFMKLALLKGETKTAKFYLKEDSFSFWDVGYKSWIVEPGQFEIRVAASSRDVRLKEKVVIVSGKVPSARAMQTHPYKPGALEHIPDSDDDFYFMLERPIPPPPKMHMMAIHLNSLLDELHGSWLGRSLQHAVVSTMKKEMENPDDPNQMLLANALAMNTPLRSLVIFSRGLFVFEIMHVFIHMINGKYFHAIWKMPGALMSYVVHLISGRHNAIV